MNSIRARKQRHSARGMTLLEILVSIAILATVSVLIYGAFESMSRGKKGEAYRADRARQGRNAVNRISRELQAAYLSLHTPNIQAMQTRLTVFVGESSTSYDRINFASFSHRRFERDVKESDQAEIGYFVTKDPDVDDKFDLCRREQTPLDMDPKRGGVVNVLAENVDEFKLSYLDANTGMWTDHWDTTQISGQPNRLPYEVKIKLTLKGDASSPPYSFTTKITIPIQQPLSFGIPQN